MDRWDRNRWIRIALTGLVYLAAVLVAGFFIFDFLLGPEAIFNVLYGYSRLESDDAAGVALIIGLVAQLAFYYLVPARSSLPSGPDRFMVDRRKGRSQFTHAGKKWRLKDGLERWRFMQHLHARPARELWRVLEMDTEERAAWLAADREDWCKAMAPLSAEQKDYLVEQETCPRCGGYPLYHYFRPAPGKSEGRSDAVADGNRGDGRSKDATREAAKNRQGPALHFYTRCLHCLDITIQRTGFEAKLEEV